MRTHLFAPFTLASASFLASGAAASEPAATASVNDPLIPREVLFGNPERAAVRVSPDGKMLSWLAPVDGVLNVWVAPVGKLGEARAVTSDRGRGIRQYFWAYTSSDILYLQDQGGDENWKVFRVGVAPGGETKDLTPFSEIAGPDGKPIMLPSGKPLRPSARITHLSAEFPEEVVVGLNTRDPRLHDLFRLNIRTGELMSLYENTDGFVSMDVDDKFNVRLATKMLPDGGVDVVLADAKGGKVEWEPFVTIGAEDMNTTSPMGFDKDGQVLFMTDSRGRNTAAMTAWDLRTRTQSVLASNDKADAAGAIVHPVTGSLQAVGFNYLRPEWTVLDESIKPDLALLRGVADGDIQITSRSQDDRTWTVSYSMDDGPTRFYVYSRVDVDREPAQRGTPGEATFLFTSSKAQENLPLTKMHPVVIKSRDGMDLVSYLVMPRGSYELKDGRVVAKNPVPLVLDVHGGPWARDSWGFDPSAQWLANRGYAVLTVNFRGSTGFGKNFLNAGNGEWAGKMHDDLIDAVNWAVAEGIADKSKVAIMGGSYGGYAALVGATFTPDVFACAISVVGPSNIITLLNTIPPHWQPMITMFTTRIGDHRTEEGRKFLESRSPLNFVDRIKKPLLIGQGANDPRVKQSESDQIVAAMKKKNIPVTYVLYPDEGHGFARPENRMSFNAVVEAFLAQNLGGRFEPIGDDFKGSSISVPEGVQNIPGLSGAMGVGAGDSKSWPGGVGSVRIGLYPTSGVIILQGT
jgi:dipeptidyl aminopeptidase/acylaminoacyl peptidase